MRTCWRSILYTFTILLIALFPAHSDEADVLSAKLTQTAPGVYQVSVEVAHADTGWDHYADGWQVFDGEGNLLATRELAHPHVNEQPFVRSLSGVRIPAGVKQVIIRARDSVHGLGGKEVTVLVPASNASGS